jgi:hypothetical protein
MSLSAKGTGAPSGRRGPTKLLLAGAAALALVLVLGVTLADAIAPTVTIKAATSVEYTTAQVKGTVDPQGQPTTYRFQYTPQAQFEAEGFENSASQLEATVEGSGPQAAEGQLTGLAPGTTYHLRLLAENGDGPSKEEAATFTTKAVAKPLVSIDPVTTFTATTAHLTGHVDPNGTDPAFDASWHFECQPECPGLTGGTVHAGEGNIAVPADAAGLQPNTTYAVKLVASNLGGETQAPKAGDPSVTFKTPTIAPTVVTSTNTPDGEGGVFVHAYVNPHNSTVSSCIFEYGQTEGDYSIGSHPCEGTVGEGNEPATVRIDPSGLEAGTTYHFKVTATGSGGPASSEDGIFFVPAEEGEEACPNETRREEQHSNFLPNCRAYEMVSPPNKNGGDILSFSQRTHAAADGNAAMFLSMAAFGDAMGTGVGTEYLSERSSAAEPGNSGWETHGITPVQEAQTFLATGSGSETAYQGDAVSPDLTRGVIRTYSPLTDAPSVARIFNIYLRDDLRSPGPGSYRLLSDCAAPPAGPCEEPLPQKFERETFGSFASSLVVLPSFRPWVAGNSADFSKVIYETSWSLANGASLSFSGNLYESNGGNVSLVGVIPPEGQTECGASGPVCVPAHASVAGQGAAPAPGVHYVPHTISADGRRIFFTANLGSCGVLGCGSLYMREDNGSPSAETVQLNVSERTDCADHHPCSGTPEPDPGGTQPASYWDASVDGSRVFFTSPEALTDDAQAGGSGVEKLYMYDTTKPASDPHNLTLLSSDHEPADVGSSVTGVIGASEDGHYVYFTASNQLVSGRPSFRTDALYLWHDGQVSFVGPLTGGLDSEDNVSNGSLVFNILKQARVSPDGRTLLFSSADGSTLLSPPYNQPSGGCTEQDGSSARCRELYVYKAATDQLLCASCNPSGAPASSTASTGARYRTGVTWPLLHLNRALSASGRYVFFNSADALVPEDTNGVFDAYRYDTQTAEVRLLSGGTDSFNSFFLEAGESGRDAFFTTNQSLVGWDADRNSDLYDARVGGGFPEPLPRAASCTGETCQGSVTLPPAAQTPGSSTLAAPGNPKPQRHHKHRRHKGHRKHPRAANSNQGGSK